MQKELNISESTNFNWGTIHPCSTMPPNSKDINFKIIYARDLYKLLNTCNHHVCNLACYKNNKDASEKLCKYGFLYVVIDETHFYDETKLLHIKCTNQWLNNANPIVKYILSMWFLE